MNNNTVTEKLEKFFAQFKRQTYKKGEILIRADDVPQGIFYLKNGVVRQYSITKDGEEQTLNLYKPVSFFPLMWAINNTPNTYYFEAVTEIEVCRAPRIQVIAFLKSESEVMFNLISRLYKGMHGLLSRIEYLQSGDAYTKVIYAILNSSYRFGEKKKNDEVKLSITHREISALTGLTKETISRECTRLEREGFITNTNHMVKICDTHKLESELLNT